MKTRLSLAAVLAAAAVAAASNADFYQGQPVDVTGNCYATFGNTGFGTGYGQGVHQLGGSNGYWDAVYGTSYPVQCSSFVNDPNSVSFVFDFASFFPSDFFLITIDITGLKSDFSIAGAQGNVGTFTTDGNNIHWEGNGADLAATGVLAFKVFQVPAPGALALVSLSGLAAGRRRRA